MEENLHQLINQSMLREQTQVLEISMTKVWKASIKNLSRIKLFSKLTKIFQADKVQYSELMKPRDKKLALNLHRKNYQAKEQAFKCIIYLIDSSNKTLINWISNFKMKTLK